VFFNYQHQVMYALGAIQILCNSFPIQLFEYSINYFPASDKCKINPKCPNWQDNLSIGVTLFLHLTSINEHTLSFDGVVLIVLFEHVLKSLDI